MSTTTDIPRTEQAEEAAPVPVTVPLPRVVTPLGPDGVLERLSTASRRGRLAGFQPGSRGTLFTAAVFGQPFDEVVIGRPVEPSAHRGGTVIEFEKRLPPAWPAVFLAVLAFTVWPGVWLTDSLMLTWFRSWYPPWGVPTWAWYLPLTVLPLPWIIRGVFRKSRAAAHDEAHKVVRKIAAEVGGTVEE